MKVATINGTNGSFLSMALPEAGARSCIFRRGNETSPAYPIRCSRQPGSLVGFFQPQTALLQRVSRATTLALFTQIETSDLAVKLGRLILSRWWLVGNKKND